MAKREQTAPSVFALDDTPATFPKIALIKIRYGNSLTTGAADIGETWCNDTASRLLAGYGGSARLLSLPEVQRAIAATNQDGADRVLNLQLGGQSFHVQLSAPKQGNDSGEIVLCLTTDTSSSPTLEKAFTDPVTGLPNMMALLQHIEQLQVERKKTGPRPASHIALLTMNINRFQSFNEGLGFDTANELLRIVGRRLAQRLENTACVARLGGDEFGILAVGSQPNFAQSLARDIHNLLQEAVTVNQRTLHLSGCVGIAYAMKTIVSGEELLRNAGIALRRARLEGWGRSVVYHDELKVRAQNQFDLEADLRQAIEQNTLELHYQPVIDVTTGSIIGFEALTRWIHPERGLIPPNDFIPIAEACNLIVPLGRWALATASKQMSKWLNAYPELGTLHCSVNVSSYQLKDENFLQDVTQALSQSALPPYCLKLEITESAIINNANLVADLLLDLKSAGVGLALDDFGTGYSSLSYLNRFPFDTLKIDRSFIRHLNIASENYKIVHIITHLAAVLGLATIAEGVETMDQLLEIQKLGCQQAQGFYFSQPMSAEHIEQQYLKPGKRFNI
jgi:diguanylate cyclase (GGDEF)-like protein